MQLIKPSSEIIEQSEGIEGIYRQIEYAGRVCYKSEDKITENSAKPFVDRLINLGHTSVLEHGTVYLSITCKDVKFETITHRYARNKYSICNTNGKESHITTNYRVLVQNNWLNDLEYLCNPIKCYEKRVTVKFICDRGILAEFTRHRTMSFSAESTRYCNYSKDKFGNELTFIQPCYLDEGKLNIYGPYHTVVRDKSPESIFIANLNNTEQDYLDLLKLGWNPQEARAILPTTLKTELVMTGFVSDWKHFFNLRCANNAHPQARELAIPLMEKFKELNLI